MKKITLLFLLISAFVFAQKSSLDQKISSIIKDKKATVGISVLGFENGFTYNKNADKKLPMQSVFKFHIAIAVLDYVEKGKLSLDQKVTLNQSNLHENTWSPLREKYPNGGIVPLSEVIEYTVAKSDNNGCDILLKLLGGTQVVQKFMNAKGVKNFQIKYNEEAMHKDWNAQYENYTTMNSAVDVLKKFYDGKLLSKKSTDYLMKVMLSTSTGINKLIEQLPKDTPIARKTGSSGKNNAGLTGAENEIAIVTLPNGKHYAIAVFVSNSTETAEVNCRMISDISKTVWDYFNK
ncbi:CGA/CIA family class A beta-lactamase [Chryseobacterium gambrini]|uniref:beta-lactamase n=1 Tax=Chryseobacterium gambrini TaxID=373672 RepID=A0AAJ1VK44_9FLAO|nr:MULTISPECIES: CGA/CIA family class A beta-lactamase [Chryseobacterium]MDN4013880.1 CGA/CIA family class A beta-lactamase [Chryseobacterium gambrini]MDN4031205.1 CGA/CIA family class A beta-lactamase [Chryseobacterium gambrini]QWA39627.1 CGA/CIA family class A beta-lactamase [Chryseobacterium sp. ZHDP1]